MNRQAGTMLLLGAQERSDEHRIKTSVHQNQCTEVTTTTWQSGHLQNAQSQLHLGASFSQAQRNHIHCYFECQNTLNSLPTKVGEDQLGFEKGDCR